MCHYFWRDETVCHKHRSTTAAGYKLHGPSMLPDKAKFAECSIISLALSFWMKHLVIGQLQKPAKFFSLVTILKSGFHWSACGNQLYIYRNEP